MTVEGDGAASFDITEYEWQQVNEAVLRAVTAHMSKRGGCSSALEPELLFRFSGDHGTSAEIQGCTDAEAEGARRVLLEIVMRHSAP
jgi:hypothetical protein